MQILHIILPILLGAVIGYLTNDIAIKMLFHPRKEVRIGKFRVPFTPGIIPKNQKRIAKAVGNAVGDQLFTTEDVLRNVKESKVSEKIASKIAEVVFESEFCIADCNKEEKFITNEEAIDKAGKFLSDQIINAVEEADLEPVIERIAEDTLSSYLKNPMIAMFLGPDTRKNLIVKLSGAIKSYISEHGEELMLPKIKEKLTTFSETPANELSAKLPVGRAMLEEVIVHMVDSLIEKKGISFAQQLHVNEIVTTKIEEMNVEELEKLTMSIMKKELQAVINLGAAIGALIGAINLLIK